MDSLAHRVVEQARGAKPVIIEGRELDGLWAAAVTEVGLPYAPTFLNREWEQVILAQDLRTEQEYLTASRAGQGTPLGKAQRRQVWALTQRVEAGCARSAGTRSRSSPTRPPVRSATAR